MGVVIPAMAANSTPGQPNFVPHTMGYATSTTFNGGFETFCVEKNEYFTPGASYYYGISQKAINGGVGGPHPDPISKGTAWLYLQFATGMLTGYDYSTMGGNASAAELQETIWWLEGEGANPNNIFSTAVMNLPNYLADNNGFYGVGVLNLWVNSDDTGLAQDQLILTGSPNQCTVCRTGDRPLCCSVWDSLASLWVGGS